MYNAFRSILRLGKGNTKDVDIKTKWLQYYKTSESPKSLTEFVHPSPGF